METTQFFLEYIGPVTVNNEYAVEIPKGSALRINWFPGNDLTVETRAGKFCFNEKNAEKIGDNMYLIKIKQEKENLKDLPIRYEKDDIIVAGNIVINNKTKEYWTADNATLQKYFGLDAI
jgi:hypothetical protein